MANTARNNNPNNKSENVYIVTRKSKPNKQQKTKKQKTKQIAFANQKHAPKTHTHKQQR